MVAFSVAIPLLAALLVVNPQEVFRRMSRSVLVETAQVTTRLCAFTAVVAGFWRILWIAGVAVRKRRRRGLTFAVRGCP